ncbi:MAG TPA: PilZ domain-containing protein [Kofleriaceae bacterium]|nr:PilZ domain-containing protein [Kofleriaceae bacterium]
MGAVRLEIRLNSQSEWIKIFDPRDWTVFVPNEALGEDADSLDNGAPMRIDLNVGGWLVTLRGTVVGTRDEPPGVLVALGGTEREKINYLNGFVRGGLLNLREKRRLPIKLSVTYGAIEGPAKTFTKDINEEGVFLFTDKPLPETSQVHMLVTVPGKDQPLSLVGKVSHTILEQDEEPPGMGIVFDLDDAQRELLQAVIKELEEQLEKNQLPEPAIE